MPRSQNTPPPSDSPAQGKAQNRTLAESADDGSRAYRDHVTHLAQHFFSELGGMGEAAGRLSVAMRRVAARSPKIFTCSRDSVANAVAMCALTELYPGGPLDDVYLIPRWNGKARTNELNWQIAARGLVKLAARAGYEMKAKLVLKGDHFEYEEGSSPRLVHTPALDRVDPEGPAIMDEIVCAYTLFRPIGSAGPYSFVVIDKSDILHRRSLSEGWRTYLDKGYSTPWAEWPKEMVLKTSLIYAISRGAVPLEQPWQKEALRDHDILLDTTAEEVSRRHDASTTDGDIPSDGGMSALEHMAGTVEVALDTPMTAKDMARRSALPPEKQAKVLESARVMVEQGVAGTLEEATEMVLSDYNGGG